MSAAARVHMGRVANVRERMRAHRKGTCAFNDGVCGGVHSRGIEEGRRRHAGKIVTAWHMHTCLISLGNGWHG